MENNEKLPVLLIASGAFLDLELEVEFGRIPPAFLPLGNRCLYAHQIAQFEGKVSRTLLSVPESFVISENDAIRLNKFGIEVIHVPEHLSLGESIVYVINISAIAGVPLLLIHGDTLLTDIDISCIDGISFVHEPQPDYQWGGACVEGEALRVVSAGESDNANAVLTGYFSFSDSMRLVQCITSQRGAFIGGLKKYGENKPFKPIKSKEWFDFGHAGTYHRSRSRFTTQREFNSLTADVRSITKSGSNSTKIEAEAMWFEELPQSLSLYSPSYLGRRSIDGSVAYELEYMLLPPLSDLYVFGRLRINTWTKIFKACDEVMSALASVRVPEVIKSQLLPDIYLQKTLDRLEAYSSVTGLDLNRPCCINGRNLPSLNEMVSYLASAISPVEPGNIKLVHGDFCFNNLLYDARAGQIRMIDPRGLNSLGEFSIWGDARYDVAKMHHSIIGFYDHIIAGNYKFDYLGDLNFNLLLPNESLLNSIGSDFMSHKFGGLVPSDSSALPISALLFFSMLPLHADNPERQHAFLANGMRLFDMFDRFSR